MRTVGARNPGERPSTAIGGWLENCREVDSSTASHGFDGIMQIRPSRSEQPDDWSSGARNYIFNVFAPLARPTNGAPGKSQTRDFGLEKSRDGPRWQVTGSGSPGPSSKKYHQDSSQALIADVEQEKPSCGNSAREDTQDISLDPEIVRTTCTRLCGRGRMAWSSSATVRSRIDFLRGYRPCQIHAPSTPENFLAARTAAVHRCCAGHDAAPIGSPFAQTRVKFPGIDTAMARPYSACRKLPR